MTLLSMLVIASIPLIAVIMIALHCEARWDALSLVMPWYERALRVGKDALILLLLFSVNLGLVFVFLFHERLAWWIVSFLAITASTMVAPLMGVPFHVFSDQKVEPFRFRELSTQILFDRALAHAKAAGWAGTEKELEALKVNAPLRSAMIARYLDEEARGRWISLSKAEAIKHEGYYQQWPLARLLWFFLSVIVIGSIALNLVTAYPTVEWLRLLFFSLYYVFGVGVALPGTMVWFTLVLLVFMLVRQSYSRVWISLLVLTYFLLSALTLPEVTQRIMESQTVQALGQAQARVTDVQRQARELVQIPLIGPFLAEVAIRVVPTDIRAGAAAWQGYQALRQLSPRAFIGFSLVYWSFLVWAVLRHLWFSEAGNIYFRQRMRRPSGFGAPTPPV